MFGLYSLIILVLCLLSNCSTSSPNDRKSKSPRSSSPSHLIENFDPFCSPQIKRKKKTVRINDKVSIDYGVGVRSHSVSSSPGGKKLRIDVPRRPILRGFELRDVPATIELFKTASLETLQSYYDQGTQLPMSKDLTFEMLKFLFETRQIEKLKLIFEKDSEILLNFILSSTELPDEFVMNFAQEVFNAQPDVLDELEPFVDDDPVSFRVTFYLYACQFDIEKVYQKVIELIEDYNNTGNESSSLAADALMESFYSNSDSESLLIYSSKTDSEEGFITLFNFKPSELDILDSEGCSVVYYASLEGKLDILTFLKGELIENQPLKGKSPLVAAAINDRDDSLEFFLDEPRFYFSTQQIEEAALTSAVHGNFGILKLLAKTNQLNLYCNRGKLTLLSLALENDHLGYALKLFEKFNYNVNYSGEDPINPNGHALAYLLDGKQKYPTIETLLKMGANTDIMVPTSPFTPDNLIHLSEYLSNSTDQKLVALFRKYML